MKKHENLILLLLVVLIAAVPLIWNAGSRVVSVCAAGCDRRRVYRLLAGFSAGASQRSDCLIPDAISGLPFLS